MLNIVNQNAFGQFQFQLVGADAGALNGVADDIEEVFLAELPGRQVDGDALQLQPLLLPARQLPAGLFQHPLANRDDQAGVFNNGNKQPRRNGAFVRVMPAQ